MAAQLGSKFMTVAFGPVAYAGRCIMARQVDAGLAQLTVDNLMGGVEQGIDTVSKSVGVPSAYVSKLLPMDALRELIQRIENNQRIATGQWQVHTGHVGGLLSGVADLTVDGRPPDVGLCLLRLSEKMKRDKDLAGPLRILSEDLDRWQLMLGDCRDSIDNGRELVEAYRRRRLVRVVAAATILVVLSVMLFWAYSRQLARSRVDAQLDAGDPCAVEAISETDLERASSAQLARLDQEQVACEAQRDQARQERAAKEKAEARKAAEAKQRREHETRCDRLARNIEGGTLGRTDEALAKGAAPLLRRVAQGQLRPADVSAELQPTGCEGTPGGDRIARAVAEAVVASGPRWLTLTSLSKSVRKLVAAQWSKLPAERRKLFDGHIEEIARRALRSGQGEEMDRCLQLCKLKEEAKAVLGDHCQAALSLVQP